jgi:hypothetical protein
MAEDRKVLVLDGLRGVALLSVLAFHCEADSKHGHDLTGRPPVDRGPVDFVKRTDHDGVARVSHTFRHVSASQTFRFKVRAPHQAGYPYLAGHSHVQRKTVTDG